MPLIAVVAIAVALVASVLDAALWVFGLALMLFAAAGSGARRC